MVAGAVVAGCSQDPVSSRLSVGDKVVVVIGQQVAPAETLAGKWSPVDNGTPGIVIEDPDDQGGSSKYRDVTVRFEGQPPWTGRIARDHLRAVAR
jgi:hypothetical protein